MDDTLNRGDDISPSLLHKAIEESSVFVIVFSLNTMLISFHLVFQRTHTYPPMQGKMCVIAHDPAIIVYLFGNVYRVNNLLKISHCWDY
jgi:hypothetical protein